MVVKSPLRDLTRKIVLGVTVGGAPLLTIGCAAPPQAQPVVAAPELPEKQQVSQLLASRDPQAIDAFLAAHPTSRYNVSLLNSLPPSVLASLSRSTIAELPPQVTRHLTRRTRHALARAMSAPGDGSVVPPSQNPGVDEDLRPDSRGGASAGQGSSGRSGY